MISSIIRFGRLVNARSILVISLVAILGVCASLVASSDLSGYQLNDVVMEVGEGSLTISADKITLSGELVPATINGENIVVQEIHEMRVFNLRIQKVCANKIIEITGSKANGNGIVIRIEADGLENVGIDYFLKMLVEKNQSIHMEDLIIKDLELSPRSISNRSMTIYGMEVSIFPVT